VSPGIPGATAIAARGLGKDYGPIAALDDVTLEVPAGQHVVLLGPNGAGKSTLLRLLSTLVLPSAGTLSLLGQDAARGDRIALLRRLGVVSHQTFLYDHLTALENLVLYARLYDVGAPASAAAAALEEAGLSGRAADQVRTFSRGMQQRLAIARALLHNPDIVLLDEPFTGLDRASGDALEARLRAERGRRTCVLSTHDFDRGLRCADRVVVLSAGRLVADRPAAGLDAARLLALFRDATGQADPKGRA
jgi:heme exporter protein A